MEKALRVGRFWDFIPADEKQKAETEPGYHPLSFVLEVPNGHDQADMLRALGNASDRNMGEAALVTAARCIRQVRGFLDEDGSEIEWTREKSHELAARLRSVRRLQVYIEVQSVLALSDRDFRVSVSRAGSPSSRTPSTVDPADDGSADSTQKGTGSGLQDETGS